MHDLAAVNLNSYFADPEFGRNLLIEHSRNHKSHHFMLTPTQDLVAFSYSSNLRLVEATFGAVNQSSLNGLQQFLILKCLVRNSSAPDFMARTVIGTLPCAVTKMMGISRPAFLSCC